ncbi:LysR family transcriptional regulator [Actinomadura rupiterrae]|uniref:LysR family transcriptional regulator n=1 Tax=Actinomadura rupiterrae TaxID=559627 RepID=UPI0020A4F159|nr:LysR family transcriptional regulator [Actinomadura rupiterrae]MCP2341851.1 DNA-binding transcriptional LysR family regulator [Actinomadura rupiterrae]
MELRHLRHFVALAEERNFTRAAERELIVQSGLSSSVRALEREVGADLFVRGSRPVRLTAEGRALLPAARRTLESAEAARQAVQDVRGLLSGHLRIGTYPINPRLLPLPALLLAFARAHPALDVSVRQIPGLSTAAKVADGELDCALFDQVGPPAPGLRAIPLISEEFQVAVPSAHPLAGRRALTLQDLADQPFVETDPTWTTRYRTDAAFAEAAVPRRIVCEVADWQLLRDLVQAGLGIALAPPTQLTARADDPENGIRLIPLKTPKLSRHLALVLPTTPTPAATHFAQSLTTHLTETPT